VITSASVLSTSDIPVSQKVMSIDSVSAQGLLMLAPHLLTHRGTLKRDLQYYKVDEHNYVILAFTLINRKLSCHKETTTLFRNLVTHKKPKKLPN